MRTTPRNSLIILETSTYLVLGVQLVIMGLLGEMLARVYHESQGKPIFTVKKVLGR